MDPLQSPLNPQAPRAETTPIPGQPLQSQGMPTGQDPSMMPGQEFATPEERQQLKDLLEATNEKMANLRTSEFQMNNTAEAGKLDALRQLFGMMQAAGVDLASNESVNAFLEKIKSSNPNLAEGFEEAIEGLLGEDESLTAETSENETLQEDLRGFNGEPQVME